MNSQYASSFHYFQAAINLKPDFANSYMYLGIVLSKLGDFATAKTAFEKALELDPEGWDVHINYSIVLLNNEKLDDAKKIFE